MAKTCLKSKSKHITWKSKLRTWSVQNKVQTKFYLNNIWKCKPFPPYILDGEEHVVIS
jgi:hypothetical protein